MSDIIDINVYETSEDVTINVTESVIEVNINQVSSGSIGAWGSIIGDIEDQTDLQNALDLKVDKVAGKELSENDFTDILKTKLDGISPGAEVNVNADWNSVSGDSEILNKPTIPSIAGLATVTYVDNQDALKEDDLGNPLVDGYVLSSTIAGVRSWVEQSGGGGGGTWGTITGTLSDQTDLQNALDNKVDKVVGKELSTNDFTDALETKLNGIEAGAEVNVNADWNAISGDAQILNKPAIPTNTSDLTNDGADGVNPFITALDITVDSVNGQTGVVVLDADDIDDTLTTNKFVTAADLTILSNTSGVNTGDQDLTGLVPYTGATSDVNLGEFGLQTGNIEFDLTPTAAPTTVGSMVWNDQAGTVDLKLKGGNVTLQIGQETVARVVNKTATNITLLEANYQVVRITGAQGGRPKVDLALADNDLNSTTTLGIVTETILNNEEGFITTSGQVQQINTTGSLQGETWADGDIIYLSGTVAGRLTNIKPAAPIHTVIMGIVEYAHITQGKIFVKVDNGYELEELHNVSAIAPNNNEVLTYDTASLLWKPKTVSTALGYTPVNETRLINTTSPLLGGGDLSADRTLSIQQATSLQSGYLSSADWSTFNNKQNALTNPITGTGTTNKIPKFTGSTALGDSQIFDNGSAVGIGTTTPGMSPNNSLLGFVLGSNIQARTAVPQLAFSSNIDGDWYAPTYKANGFAAQILIDPANMSGNQNGINFNVATTGTAGSAITWSRAMTVIANGNLGLAITTPTEKLHVVGNGLFSGNVRASNVGIGAAANLASYLNVIANTASVGQLYLPPSAVDYTGTLSGMLWNNASEWKFYDGVLSSVNRLLKLNGNTVLANANALNVVTSTGTGGNLGTLKAEVAFSRFATAVSYTILLTDVGFGWVIGVTDTAAARTITLPLANAVPAGWQTTIKDESGGALTNNITIARAGSDTIDGATSNAINLNYGSRTLYSDGVSKWFTI